MASSPSPVDPAPADDHVEIELQPWRYTAACIGVHVAIVLAILLRTSLGGVHFSDWTLWYGDILLVFLALYWLASWRRVQTDQIGGIIVLEHESKEVKRGWKFIPRGIVELHKIPRGFQQNEFPGEPEQISHVPDNNEFRTEMLKPIRITTGDQKGDGKDIMDTRYTFDPRFVVEWYIEHRGIFEFLIHIPGATAEEKIAFIIRMLRDSGQKALEFELPKYSGSTVLDNKEKITNAVKRRLKKESAEWGIGIREVSVLNLVPTRETNIAINSIADARATARQTVITADAEKIRLAREGEGRGAARKAELEGEGAGIKKAAADAGVAGPVYRAGEVAKAIADKGNVFLGTEGVTQVFGLAERLVQSGRGGAK